MQFLQLTLFVGLWGCRQKEKRSIERLLVFLTCFFFSLIFTALIYMFTDSEYCTDAGNIDDCHYNSKIQQYSALGIALGYVPFTWICVFSFYRTL